MGQDEDMDHWPVTKLFSQVLAHGMETVILLNTSNQEKGVKLLSAKPFLPEYEPAWLVIHMAFSQENLGAFLALRQASSGH